MGSVWVYVSDTCFHLSGTRIDLGVWMQTHQTPEIFSFLFPLLPSSSVFLQYFCFHLSNTDPANTTTLSQTFHIESKATFLGHFIPIAKHNNLVYNTYTEYAAHTWSYRSKATERQEAVRSGQKPNYFTTNRPHRIFLLLWTECWGGSLIQSPPVSFVRGQLLLL